jgi:predicted membrane protein
LIIANGGIGRDHDAFTYALTGLIIGGVIAVALIAGFIYLVMQGHPAAAGSLLGTGALGMVAAFRATRL